jgi:hypothetical protein
VFLRSVPTNAETQKPPLEEKHFLPSFMNYSLVSTKLSSPE